MNATKKLGEVFEIRKGKKAAAVAETQIAGSFPYIQIDEVRGVKPSKFAIDTKPVLVTEDDICIVWDGANAGTIGYGVHGAVGSTVARMRLKSRKDWEPRFLGRLLERKFPQLNQEAQGRGATIPHVDKARLEAIEFPRIPPSEQRRIATILDKAAAIRRKREQGLALAEEFLKSVFLQMFGDLSSNDRNWRTKPIGQILELEPQNGLYRHSSDYGSGTQILRIDGFYDGYLSAAREMKRLNIDQRTVKTYGLINGDIVINRVNSPEYLGKCALIEGLTEPMVFESNMMRFRVDAHIANPRFIVDQLRSAYLKNQIARAAKPAVNQSSINQKDVKSFEVRLPPPELQNKYSELVAAKLNADNGLQSAFSMAILLLDSLSQRAFCGEL